MSKLNKIMELFWLSMIGVTFIMSVYFINVEGFDSGKYYLLLPLICAAAYGMRRITRKRLEAMVERDEERKHQSKGGKKSQVSTSEEE
jgi:hypothetical protein